MFRSADNDKQVSTRRRGISMTLLGCVSLLAAIVPETAAAAGTAIAASGASAAVSATSARTGVSILLDVLGHFASNSFVVGVGTAVGGMIGFVATWYGKEWSADWAARRTFAQDTTKLVVELSNQHYWALANATGTFGATLRNYLRGLELHLLVHHAEEGRTPEESARALQQRIGEVATEASDRAFPALVRMIYQFDLFQFRGSKTYLLPTQARGDDLRRLYNQIASNLPDGPFLTDVRRAVEMHLIIEDKTKAGDAPPGIAGTFLEREHEFSALGFAPLRGRFETWLLRDLSAVCEVQRAAMAFEHVMHAELGRMTRPFFNWWQRRAEPRDPRIESIIERAWAAGTSYVPLGGASIAGAAMSATAGVSPGADRAGQDGAPVDGPLRGPGESLVRTTSPMGSGVYASGVGNRQ